MPPIHLIMWGDPNKEPYDEVEEVFAAWELANTNPNTSVAKVTSTNPSELYKAIKTAIEDPEAQIIYLSCHGDRLGLAFSSSAAPTITQHTLSQWLHGMSPSGDRWLVFGFCYSMNSSVRIEKLMPKWVTRVGGFTEEPRAPEVAQLMAGITSNLHDWVHEVMEKTGELLEKYPPTNEDPWKATERAFNAAADITPDDPARNNLPSDRDSIIIATRNPDTLEWIRKTGTDFIKKQ